MSARRIIFLRAGAALAFALFVASHPMALAGFGNAQWEEAEDDGLFGGMLVAEADDDGNVVSNRVAPPSFFMLCFPMHSPCLRLGTAIPRCS